MKDKPGTSEMFGIGMPYLAHSPPVYTCQVRMVSDSERECYIIEFELWHVGHFCKHGTLIREFIVKYMDCKM